MLKLKDDAQVSDENNPAAVLAEQSRDPEMALARENATLRQRLAELESGKVVANRFAGEPPKYYLNEACHLDDTWYPAGTTLEWTGVPNMSMAPVNAPAKRAMDAYIEGLENGARKVAALRGREYFGLTTDRNMLIDTARMDAKVEAAQAAVPVILAPTPTGHVPAMPHMVEARAAARRNPRSQSAVLSSQPPETIMPPDVRGQTLAPTPAPTERAVVGRVIGG